MIRFLAKAWEEKNEASNPDEETADGELAGSWSGGVWVVALGSFLSRQMN
jgi:hypothetical protein